MSLITYLEDAKTVRRSLAAMEQGFRALEAEPGLAPGSRVGRSGRAASAEPGTFGPRCGRYTACISSGFETRFQACFRANWYAPPFLGQGLCHV